MSLIPCPTGHVICPYNKSHVIRKERIQFHLTKCQPNAGDKPFVVCPFNSTHLIPATEINNHKTNLCPDRIKLDSFLYDISNTKPLFEVNKIEIESEENWDDCPKHSYDPETAVREKKILVLKQVAPPSERKKFNAEQRRKFQTLPDDEPISTSKSSKTKPRLPNTKAITQIQKNENVEQVPQVQEKKKEPVIQKLEPVIQKMENISVTEKMPTKSDEFELVVSKKKNKNTNAKSSANQKEAVKTNENQTKKTEPKVKKQPVLNEKNSNENLIARQEEPVNVSSKENVSVKPKEDEFIVVTKKKNKSRKN